MAQTTRQKPIGRGRSSFKILAGGTQISSTFRVHAIIVNKEFNKIASAEIILLDGNVAKGDFETSNAKEFSIGSEITIQAGYSGDDKTIFKGVVVKQGIKMNGSRSCLVVSLKNKAYKMALVRNNVVYPDKTDGEIIEDVLKKNALTGEIDATDHRHEALTQFNCNDWDFINMRAETNALLIYTGDEKIIVKKPQMQADVKLEIGNDSTIFDIEAEIDGRNAFSQYHVSAWNVVEQEVADLVQKNVGMELPQGNLSIDRLAEALQNDMFNIYVHPCLDEVSLGEDIARTYAQRNNLAKIKGRVRISGYADVHPGDMIQLARIGERFNGKTIVSGVNHTINKDGWHTNLQFGVDNTAFARKYSDIDGVGACGMLPAVNGLQIGKVVGLEDDPLQEDRILVQLPIFAGSENSFWARVATLDAGKGRGSYFRPEIGDEVVVGFIDNHPNNAIVLGMLNSSVLPAPVKAENANHIKGIYTREKLKFEFDDGKKNILMETPGGNRLMLSDEAKGFSICDQNGNKIVLDQNGITIESVKALNLKSVTDATVEANNVNMKAKMALKAEGSASAEVSTAGSAVLKGSIVQIN